LVATVLSVSSSAQTTPPLGLRDRTPELRAFTNARIIVSPQLTYDSATMIIDRGRIIAIGKNLPIPAGARVVDLTGRTIYPGFVDPFTDYGVEKTERQRPFNPDQSGGTQYLGHRVGGNAWNDAVHAERNCVATFTADAKEAKSYLKNGITVAQSAKLDGIFQGRGFVTSLGSGLPNDLLLRPFSWHFLSFDKGSSKQEYPSSLMGAIALIRQTLYDVDWYRLAQASYKVNPNQKMPEFNAMIEALASIKGEKVIFESDDVLSLLRADKLSKEFGIPSIKVGSGKEYAWVKQIAATGATLILPVDFPDPPQVKTTDDELDVTLATLRHWELAPSNPKILADNKIDFAFTTYRLKDKSDFLENVRLAVKRGLSKQTALAALTTIPAQICGVADLVGTLDKGRLANFVVSDGDLLEKDASIYSVWVAGKEQWTSDLPKVDMRGNYNLTLGEQKLLLFLKGDIGKPKGEFKLGDKSLKLQDLSLQDNDLNFTCELDTLAYRGMLRFSGTRIGNSLIGVCTLADGEILKWSAILATPFVETPDSAETKEVKDQTLISQLTYPNKAYGLTAPPKMENVLIRNATVWTSEAEGILNDADVMVVDGKIAAVGRSLKAPADIRIIDGTGKHVTAGLIDAHGHIAASGDINEGTFAITPEVRIGDVIDPEDISIYRILSGGVTMTHVLHGSANPIGGQSVVIKHRWGSYADELKYSAAQPTIKFALGENVKQSGWGERFNVRYPQTRMGVETIMKDEFQAAREYEQEWKAYTALSASEKLRTIPPRKDLGLEEMVDVLHSRALVHCHGYVASEMLMMMRLAEQFGFKVGTFVHVGEGYKIADEMAKHDAMAGGYVDWWAYKFEVYDGSAYNPSLLTERGVVFGVNSDSPDMARRLNSEAGKTILYGGIKPEEAIKMVTINPAKQLGVDKFVGSIKAGKDADFVIWNGDPLSTYSIVEQTWIEGRRYFDRETDKRLRDDNQKQKAALIQKVLKTGGNKGKGDPRDGIDIWEGRDEQ
jgi:imidazolonepropionase-like amidohydrolase